jgi:hypothetical protein
LREAKKILRAQSKMSLQIASNLKALDRSKAELIKALSPKRRAKKSKP